MQELQSLQSLHNIRQVRICNDDTLKVVYKNLKENKPDNGKANIFVAAFTTCWVHLKLYSYLEQLQQRVLYFDIDSVIYSLQPGELDIPLGEMTDKLEGEDHNEDFMSAGPKNYRYRTKNGKVCCNVWEFTLNFCSSQQLNFNMMQQNLLDEIQHPLDERCQVPVRNPNHFTRNPATKQLKVGPLTKHYGLVFEKHVVAPVTFQLYPYGCT